MCPSLDNTCITKHDKIEELGGRGKRRQVICGRDPPSKNNRPNSPIIKKRKKRKKLCQSNKK